MTAEIELLPLPSSMDSWFVQKMEAYARDNVAYATTTLQAELVELRAECEKLRKDAERYRWLRRECKNPLGVLTIARVTEWGLEGWSGDDPDNRIDAALSKENRND